MNARHRVSRMLLRHGRVYPKPSTWTQEHRRWLAAQQFAEPMSELTWADLIACVDGLTARKKTLAERIAELATDPAWWPTVARLRAFRGVDTLTALAVHLELGADWQGTTWSGCAGPTGSAVLAAWGAMAGGWVAGGGSARSAGVRLR